MHNGLQAIAAINSGSSSLKFGLFTADTPLNTILNGSIHNIGRIDCQITLEHEGEKEIVNPGAAIYDVEDAALYLVKWLQQRSTTYNVAAIGHRIVHGGLRFSEPEVVDEKFIDELEALVPLAPLHLPAAIAILKVFTSQLHSVVQVACFDTAFHAHMPFEARHYALPRSLWDEGIVRYGFHGLSCEYILHQLQQADERINEKKIIIAHLGAGSSITAIRDGKSIENTMGFSPAGGLVMNTRAGDIDPGVMSYLMKHKKMNADQLESLFNKNAGLEAIAVAGGSMQQLLQDESRDSYAAQAVLLYCYHVKKQVAALTAALGGLDILVFTGGIGENSPVIRQRVCRDLGFLGIELNKALNDRNLENISELPSPVQVFVLPTNEELMIAKHVKNFVHEPYNQHAGR
jgi:acetate kinase